MPISADQIYAPTITPWAKKKQVVGAMHMSNQPEPVSITVPQIIVASHIIPALPSLPPLNHS